MESTTLRLSEFSFKPSKAKSESQRLADLPSRRVRDLPTRQVGNSFFDYEYLRKFEAKIGTVRKVVEGIYEQISAKTPENPPHAMSL